MDGFIGFRRSKTIEMKASLIILAIQFFFVECFCCISSHKPPFRLNIVDFRVTLKKSRNHLRVKWMISLVLGGPKL